jgi:hypothetical protein
MDYQAFFAEHAEYLGKGDIDGLIRDHYHEDADMVTFEFVLKGADAIKQYLAVDNPAQAGKILSFDVQYLAGSEDVIVFTAKVHSEKLGRFVARDSFYIVDGKIKRHIALTLPPDKDKAITADL